MARKEGKGKHLGKDNGHKRRGRRNALICLIVALGLVAGVSYARWTRVETNDTQEAGESLDTAEEATDDAADESEANIDEAAEDGDSGDAGSNSETDESGDSSEDAQDSDQQAETESHPGEHGNFSAEDLSAMEALRGQISVSGARDGFAESDGYQELLYQVATWQRSGYALGFVLTDLGSGASVSYNTDQVFYPASSIKAPYVCSLYEELVETGTDEAALDPVAESTIVNSDNDAFRQLHATYGEDAFSAWLSSAGVPATQGHAFSYFAQYYYPQISTSQLDLMWSAIYRYCTSGTAASQVLAGYLSERTTSPIADAVGDRYASWGKAGWYYSSGDYGAEPATVDAGIVFADRGTYRLVMMSDAPGELDRMADLAWGMDAAAAELAD